MSHRAPGSNEHAARFQLATNFEMGAALQAIDDNVNELRGDVQQQIRAALHALAPDSITFACQVSHGANRQPFKIGNGEMSVVRKLTLVRIVAGAFPSSVVWQLDDVSGSYVLDTNQQSIEIGQVIYGERNLFITNNDGAVDAAVLVVCDRVRL